VSNGVVAAPDLWRAALEGSATAVIAADTEGRITVCNPAATALLCEDAPGKHLADYFPDLPPGAAQTLLSASLRPAGGAEPLHVEGTISSGDNGTLLTFCVCNERQRLQQAAERASTELQEFAYIVSHDLNAPLRSVKSFVELLERRCGKLLDPDAVDYLGFITAGAREMEALLNAVLAYSQAGREDKTRPQATDSTGTLHWALMNVDGLTKQTGAQVTWDTMPKVWVDQAQLAQVFQHLLANAMKFRSDATPVIHVSAHETDDGMIEFAVSDNGTGIDSGQLTRIFGVFRRLVGKDVPGVGIGLSICRKIVEAHGGRMWAESEVGKGSTFRFTLPPA
jgi:light-regulated signal transduction histidine kinase (bacteriophytochrome)